MACGCCRMGPCPDRALGAGGDVMKRQETLNNYEGHIGTECPHCGHSIAVTVDSRPGTFMDASSRRRRKLCKACDQRFTTFEVVAESDADFVRDAKRVAATAILRHLVDDFSVAELGAMMMDASK